MSASTSVHTLGHRPSGGTARGVGVFLALTFGLAWLPFLVGMGGALMPVAPAVACIVVRKFVAKEGFGDVGLQRAPVRWLGLATGWPLLVASLAVVLAGAFGVDHHGLPIATGREAEDLLGTVALALVATPIFLGEELGWRGYLQLRIFRTNRMAAWVTTGAIWGIWHYPMILAGDQPTESIATTLVAFPVSTIVLSVFLGWMRDQTGSTWATAVAHAANNVTNLELTRLVFAGPNAEVLPTESTAPIVLAEALVLLGVVAVYRSREQRRARAATEAIANITTVHPSEGKTS